VMFNCRSNMGQASSGVGKNRRHMLQYTFLANFAGQSCPRRQMPVDLRGDE
jgi:hypothetical protein